MSPVFCFLCFSWGSVETQTVIVSCWKNNKCCRFSADPECHLIRLCGALYSLGVGLLRNYRNLKGFPYKPQCQPVHSQELLFWLKCSSSVGQSGQKNIPNLEGCHKDYIEQKRNFLQLFRVTDSGRSGLLCPSMWGSSGLPALVSTSVSMSKNVVPSPIRLCKCYHIPCLRSP